MSFQVVFFIDMLSTQIVSIFEIFREGKCIALYFLKYNVIFTLSLKKLFKISEKKNKSPFKEHVDVLEYIQLSKLTVTHIWRKTDYILHTFVPVLEYLCFENIHLQLLINYCLLPMKFRFNFANHYTIVLEKHLDWIKNLLLIYKHFYSIFSKL